MGMEMSSIQKEIIQQLVANGTRIPVPESVEIGEDVNPRRISGQDVVIHAGCRIFGANTWISYGVRLGSEAPATVRNCQLGPKVKLKGGFFDSAVFLEGAEMGSGAHVRAGTILEEQAGGAHSVALKQTILFPFVILGSLINFCDCFMAGGTDRRNHSEVGSSYIHFNYTPNQDKATASMMGDVPRGVMLDQPPILLGGQGGLVGPCRVEYGSIIAAGSILRKDVLTRGQLSVHSAGKSVSVPFTPGSYLGVQRIVTHNLHYIANLAALMQWYRNFRRAFISINFPPELHTALVHNLEAAMGERVRRLGELAGKMARSIEIQTSQSGAGVSSTKWLGQKEELNNRWPEVEAFLTREALDIAGDAQHMDRFMAGITRQIEEQGSKNYIQSIREIDPRLKQLGTAWLQSIVDDIAGRVMAIMPSFAPKQSS